MLVLSRKVGQSLFIGDNIEVIVTKLQEGRVSLGIRAPNDVHIKRSELKNKNEGTDNVDQRTTTNS